MSSRLDRCFNISDMRAEAKKILPRGLFEFIDRAVEDEISLRANQRALEDIFFQPRVVRDVAKRSLAINLLGQTQPLPIVVAPTGAAGMAWFDGEIAVAQAAREAGIPYALSTASLTSIERMAAEAGGRLWFQLYIVPDWSHTEKLIERAKAAKFETLVVTVDSVIDSNREYNKRSGFSVPMRITPRNVLDCALHPRWSFSVFLRYLATTGLPRFSNLPMQGSGDLRTQKVFVPKMQAITWDMIQQLRRMWGGPVLVKGVLHPEDAALAVNAGMDGVIVSNHGGRSIDSAVPPILALEKILDRTAGRIPVLIDSGFRRGTHIAKALAMGASAVCVGRAPLYGTAVAGKAGARKALSLLEDELERTMIQLGCPTVKSLTRGVIWQRPQPAA